MPSEICRYAYRRIGSLIELLLSTLLRATYFQSQATAVTLKRFPVSARQGLLFSAGFRSYSRFRNVLPQCGQQQVSRRSGIARGGFLLEGVNPVVASGGQLPMRYVQSASRELSPRSKGVRQGAMLMLSTLLMVPIVAIVTVSLNIFPEVLIPLVSIFCFIGGLLRMLALMMEDANPPTDHAQLAGYAPPVAPQLPRPSQTCRIRRPR